VLSRDNFPVWLADLNLPRKLQSWTILLWMMINGFVTSNSRRRRAKMETDSKRKSEERRYHVAAAAAPP